MILASKSFQIKKTPKSLLDLKVHYIYSMYLTLMTIIIDQMKHIALELFYDRLGPETAFHIWLLFFVLEFIGANGNINNIKTVQQQHAKVNLNMYVLFSGSRLVFNIFILITASRRLPEFRGYKGKTYPGQLLVLYIIPYNNCYIQ